MFALGEAQLSCSLLPHPGHIFPSNKGNDLIAKMSTMSGQPFGPVLRGYGQNFPGEAIVLTKSTYSK